MILSRRLEQYKHEYRTWLRTLEFLQQENIFLKDRLTDIVKNDISTELLDKAEFFQNSFINKDTVIALLRYEIKEQNRALDEGYNNGNGLNAKIESKQGQLREDINKMESEFSKLKFEFNNYLSAIL